MKKKLLISEIVILVIIAISFIYYFNSKIPVINSPQTNQPITESSDPQENKDIKSFVKITCSDIENISDKSVQTEVNKIIKEKIAQILASEGMGKATMVSAIPEEKDINWLEIDCTSVRSDNLIFALKFNISSYGAGAAHPNQDTKTLNYSINDQKELGLKDLFKPDNDYLKLLSQLSRTHLKERLDERYFQMIDEGTLPQETNFSSFLVGKTGLTVIFNPYEVTPYSEGTQEILLKSDEMKPEYLH